jgi:hypothetical protein
MSQSNGWDVSNILLQNRSGEILGQSMANLGQQAGSFFEKYGKIKQENQAMEGEIAANTKFFNSAKGMAKDDPDRVAQLDATLVDMHDNTKSLNERYALATAAKKNFIDTYTLGEMAQRQKLAAAQTAEIQGQTALSYVDYFSRANALARQQSFMQGLGIPTARLPASALQAYAPSSPQPAAAPAASAPPQIPAQALSGTSATPQGQSGAIYNPSTPFMGDATNSYLPKATDAQATLSQPYTTELGNNIRQLQVVHYNATGNLLPENVVGEIIKDNINASTVVGYQPGVTGVDKNGNATMTWYPVNKITNGNKIQVSTTPVTRALAYGAPGAVLDDNFNPITWKNPQPLPPGGERKILGPQNEVAADLNSELMRINQAQADLKELTRANNDLTNAPRSISPMLSAVGETGNTWYNRFINATQSIDPASRSAVLFDSLAGKLTSGVMAGTEPGQDGKRPSNIRNYQEFLAVTKMIPRSEQDDSTRASLISSSAMKLAKSKAFIQKQLDYVNQGYDPQSAITLATQDINKNGYGKMIDSVENHAISRNSKESPNKSAPAPKQQSYPDGTIATDKNGKSARWNVLANRWEPL